MSHLRPIRQMVIVFIVCICTTLTQRAFSQQAPEAAVATDKSQNEIDSGSNDTQYSTLKIELENLKEELVQIKYEQAQLKEDLDNLGEKDEQLAERIDLGKERVLLEIEKKSKWIYVMGGVCGIFGLSIAWIISLGIKLKKWAPDELEKRFSDLITGLDLRHISVRIPSKLSQFKDHLEKINFKSITVYNGLDAKYCLSGCVVINIPNDQAVERFREFLIQEQPNPLMVGYVLYTTSVRVPPDVVEKFANLTYSNSLATLAQNIFTVARVLKQTGEID